MKKIKFLMAALLISVPVMVSAKITKPLESRDPDNYQLGSKFLKLNADASFGVRTGQQDEVVYETTSCNDKISELNWDMKPLFLFSGNLNLGLGNFWIRAGGKVGAGENCGTVYDKDWLNYSHGDHSTRTHYSESESRLISYFVFDLSFLYRFRILSCLKISPEVGLDYTLSEFKAVGGEYWYGAKNPWTGLYASDSSVAVSSKVSGDLVNLKRNVFNTWIGGSIAFTPWRKLSISAGGYFSPFSYVNSYDEHIARGLDFYDKMYGFFRAYKANVVAEYFFTRHYSAYFRFDVMGTNSITGRVYQKSSSNSKYYKTTAGSGCSFSSIDFSGGFRFRL